MKGRVAVLDEDGDGKVEVGGNGLQIFSRDGDALIGIIPSFKELGAPLDPTGWVSEVRRSLDSVGSKLCHHCKARGLADFVSCSLVSRTRKGSSPQEVESRFSDGCVVCDHGHYIVDVCALLST